MKKVLLLLSVLVAAQAFAHDEQQVPTLPTMGSAVNLNIDNTVSSQASVYGSGSASSTATGWNTAGGSAVATPTSISGEAWTAQGGSVVSTQTGNGVSNGSIVEHATASVSAFNPNLSGSAFSSTQSNVLGNGSFNVGSDNLFVGTIAPIAGGFRLDDSKLSTSFANATNATVTTSGIVSVQGHLTVAPIQPIVPVHTGHDH